MKGCIFDLDGVITDTAKYHYQAWKYLGEQIGIIIDATMNEQLKGLSRMDSLELILTSVNKSTLYTAEEKQVLAHKKNDYYLTLLEELTPDDLLEGVAVFLDQLKEKNIPCAIASASKNAPYILKKLKIIDRFDAIVDPSQLIKGKPDPEIFIRAVELIDISPQEAVGFEDSQAGIDGMKQCGMYTIGIDNNQIGKLKGANQVISTMNDLSLEELLLMC